MAIIFDGKSYALKKAEVLKKEVLDLNANGIFPHLASIIVGNNPASKLYVGLKKKAGEKIGIQVDVYYLSENTKKEDLLILIKTLNEDRCFSGIMIQLPLPENLKLFKEEILNTINSKKDVDGLRGDSQFLHPTSKAVIKIIDEAKEKTKKQFKNVCVVGATGMVGESLVKKLKEENYEVTECGKNTKDLKSKTLMSDILVSATGEEGLISEDMVKDDVIIVDVGSPKGDVNFSKVLKKASFITPVPGGVGPVTIFCLLENLIIACKI
ncbi:MAG: tetrahydrofolate dehydrogenase/cyclohydrolase catalytic domain-containing protein [Candidatus Woesebacteria bacterium]|nr:tetrahydrofolate dehydrogenase/cyclohydrolase catalytic domain-containing protein [Candidatus Woesebacteria bacterium]